MKQSIAIIGGNGFIGKNFVSYFLRQNFDVTVIDRSVEAQKNSAGVTAVAADIHHTAEIIRAAEPCDYVLWLVHASVPSTQDESLVDDFMLNVSPIIKFLEKSASLPNMKKFIYLSSGGTVYGNIADAVAVPESHEQHPISGYGLSKSVAEKYIEFLSAGKDYQTVVLRPSNVYGPYQNLVKPQGIIGFAFKALRAGNSLDLYDGGKVVRDFIFVEDLADAVFKIISSEKTVKGESFYNVGSSEGHSIKEILERIEKISGSRLQLNHKSSRNFDCAYNVLDSSKIKNDYGWDSSTPLDQGLQKVWEWILAEY